ncbi:MAG: tetratricopeptide repeat protein [Bacteroidales bacterium]|nr:tetratricopeptide repeat protein [Bacteroidales bacterium]
MKKIVSIVIFLFFTIGLFASENDSLIDIANKKYSEGLYNEAIENYQIVIDKGYASSELYFNLGNSYFKMNDLPSSILYYERARRLAPNDEDIKFNLKTVNSRIPDKIEKVPELFFKRWWNSFYNMFSVNNWAKITILVFVITLFFTGIFILSKQRGNKIIAFWVGLVFLLLSVFAFGLSYQKYIYSQKHHEAIVFTPTITIKSSPDKNSVDLFVIHEGAKLIITDKVGDWYEIRIASGGVGWLPQSSVEII